MAARARQGRVAIVISAYEAAASVGRISAKLPPMRLRVPVTSLAVRAANCRCELRSDVAATLL